MQRGGVHTRGGRCWRNRVQKQSRGVSLLVVPWQRFKVLLDVPWPGNRRTGRNIASTAAAPVVEMLATLLAHSAAE